jgi:tRNA (guanine26-N2/guanine27-N2)-dimethyltransferase
MVAGAQTALAEFREGLARIFYRKGENFINPAQVVNRDLSVLVLRYFWRLRNQEHRAEPRKEQPLSKLQVLEALSATGLRAVRYCREVGCIERIVANDIDPRAYETLCENVQRNPDLNGMLVPHCADAYEFMASHRCSFDIIDLDPFGSAAPLLDPAVRALRDGGLLCVTCTDSRVLCGKQPEICFSRYHATSLAAPYAHEEAIRLVMGAIAQNANRHGRHMEPLLALYIDFYVRVFVRILDRRAPIRGQAVRTGGVFHCTSCNSFWVQPLGQVKTTPSGNESPNESVKFGNAAGPPVGRECSVCHSPNRLVFGGPFYLGALHSADFVNAVRLSLERGEDDGRDEGLTPPLHELLPYLAARERVHALLTLAGEELFAPPFYLHLPAMCKVLRCPMPPLSAIHEILRSRLGYRCTQCHHDPLALKTDTPVTALWDVLRAWAQLQPQNKHSPSDEISKRILEKTLTVHWDPPLTAADFERRSSAHKIGNSAKRARYPSHPAPNWGPMKATRFLK